MAEKPIRVIITRGSEYSRHPSVIMAQPMEHLKHDYATTMIQRVSHLDTDAVEIAFQKIQNEGRATLTREGVDPNEMKFTRQVEMRHVGQSYELGLALPNGTLNSAEINVLLNQFHLEHERAYGFCAPNETTEFVNLRLTAMGKIAKPDASLARKESRRVYFAERGSYVHCAIYDRYRLGAGVVIHDHGISEEFDSTTVVHPGH
jgi:N-methylhydantoinase A